MRHCLEKEPENRFQSARDLAFALETLSSCFRRTENAAQRFAEASERRPMGGRGSASGCHAAAAGKSVARPTAPPTYQRLTFEQGTVYSARFAPDFRAVVYGAAWNDKPLQIFSTVGDSLLSQPLNLTDANLLAISRSGELAVALHGAHMAHLQTVGGTLARAPLAGGSPREVLEDVPWADWDANGELAVVHHAQGPRSNRVSDRPRSIRKQGMDQPPSFFSPRRQDRVYGSSYALG